MSELESKGQEIEEEEGYAKLDLDGISDHIHIPPNTPYVLSDLDTLNPILIIDGKIKLIGEYEETIGTCFVFNEGTPGKQVNTVARLNKILKFRLCPEEVEKQAKTQS